jgi:hypothetical protein
VHLSQPPSTRYLPEYVGPETWLELAETWYRCSVFCLEPGDDVAELLDDDLWDEGLDPRQHIRNVQIRVESCCPPKEKRSRLRSINVVKDASMLLQLRVPVRITIVLDLTMWGHTFEDDHIMRFTGPVALCFFPLLKKMLKDEWRVMMQVKGSSSPRSSEVKKSDPVALKREELNAAHWCRLVKECLTIESSASES